MKTLEQKQHSLFFSLWSRSNELNSRCETGFIIDSPTVISDFLFIIIHFIIPWMKQHFLSRYSSSCVSTAAGIFVSSTGSNRFRRISWVLKETEHDFYFNDTVWFMKWMNLVLKRDSFTPSVLTFYSLLRDVSVCRPTAGGADAADAALFLLLTLQQNFDANLVSRRCRWTETCFNLTVRQFIRPLPKTLRPQLD